MVTVVVDAGSVSTAARAVRSVGARLDGAPGGAALRLVAVSLPGSQLAQAAGDEAAEWAAEMSGLAAVFERYAAALEAALADYRRHDVDSADSLRSARVAPGR